jgi:hypothetical protein
MTIVRSLLTKIGFQVDKSGLERFEKSILGFKAKFAIAAGSVAYFTTKTLDYFSSIATASRDVGDLARNTKVATEEFIALRKSAEDLQLDPKGFDSAFLTLSKDLREAQSGFGRLFEIIRNSRYEVDLQRFVKSGDVKGAFVAIIDYIATLEDAANRFAASSDIFGEANANGILRIVEAGSDAFLKGADANREYAKSFAETIPKSKEYLGSLTKFYTEFEKLQVSFVENVLPLVTKGVEILTQTIKGAAAAVKDFMAEGISGNIKKSSIAAGEGIFRLLGNETASDKIKRVNADNEDFARRLTEFNQNGQVSNGPVTITNSIEVNVPPGTPEEQGIIIGTEIQRVMQNFFDEKTREVIANNPQVE